MAIFRGVGGSGDSSDNSFLQEVTAQATTATTKANEASASATSAANSLATIQNTEVTSAAFNTGDGVLTLTKLGGATVTADLDGRFLTSADTAIYLTAQDITGKANLSGATFTGLIQADGGLLIPETARLEIGDNSFGGNNTYLSTNASGVATLEAYNNLTIKSTNNVTLAGNGNVPLVKGVQSSGQYEVSLYYGPSQERLITKSGGVHVTGAITLTGTVDGRDVLADGTKLDGIEASADVTDTANVTAAGAAMLTGASFTGTVGIGTDSPDTKLHVDGGDVKISSDQNTINGDGKPTLFFGESAVDEVHAAISYHGDDVTGNDNFVGIGCSGGSPKTQAQMKEIHQLVVNSVGNVGIGTIIPACHLEVSGSGNGSVSDHLRITSTDTEAKLAFVTTTGNGAIYQKGYDLVFANNTANTERMRIDSSGNVGIGTEDPTTPLHVKSATDAIFRLESSDSNSWNYMEFQGNTARQGWIGSDNNDAIQINADNASKILLSGGNVGIGTSSPTEALDVTGNIAVSGTVDGVDIATLNSNALVDGDFTSNGFMKRTGAGTYTVDTSSYISSYGGTFYGNVTVAGTPPSGQGILTAHFLKGNTTVGGATTPVLDLEKNVTGMSGSGRFIEFNTKSVVTGSIVTRGHLGLNQTSSNYTAFPYFSHGGGNCGFALALSGSSSFNAIVPASTIGGVTSSNINLGHQYARWNGIYLKISPNVSSDREYKRDIEELSEAEKRVAVVCKGLIRKYRMKDAYEEKGDNARLHIGIIAQDLQDAFTAEGLDAHRYGMFCSDTWHQATVTTEDEDGNVTTSVEDFELVEHAPEGATNITEITRLSVRYEELLAFIISTT